MGFLILSVVEFFDHLFTLAGNFLLNISIVIENINQKNMTG
jgi:hypothetical protein